MDSKPHKSYSFLIASATESLTSNVTGKYAQSAENSELARDLTIQVKYVTRIDKHKERGRGDMEKEQKRGRE